MKSTYTEEAVGDLVEAISYLRDRNPTAAARLDAEVTRCTERWLTESSTDQCRVFVQESLSEVGPSRRFGSIISDIPTSL